MDLETLTALQGSIAKWERIVAGTGIDHGSRNCPLCQKFAPPRWEDSETEMPCEGCPVMVATGLDRCRGSPYDKYAKALNLHSMFYSKSVEMALKAAAQAELDFLKSLLPNEDTV
jgi:hypothetical protein